MLFFFFFSKWIFTCITNCTRARDESHHFLFVCHLLHCLPCIQFTFIIAFYIHIINGTCVRIGLAKCLNKSRPPDEGLPHHHNHHLPPRFPSFKFSAGLLKQRRRNRWRDQFYDEHISHCPLRLASWLKGRRDYPSLLNLRGHEHPGRHYPKQSHAAVERAQIVLKPPRHPSVAQILPKSHFSLLTGKWHAHFLEPLQSRIKLSRS